MNSIAYHASHEQFSPSHLLYLVQLAERSGFDAIHSSDHFHPWSMRQGQSGFTLSWIAAAMQATTLPFSMVSSPGQRIHPAIVAQAIATLDEMFPGRISVELGSGEALNELITGMPWPSKEIRNERLLECAGIINDLLHGEKVSYHGHVEIIEAQLYTLPKTKPCLFCAAISEETSRWAGMWAEGLLTTAGQLDETQRKIDAFRENAGPEKEVYVQFAFSYGPDRQKAIEGAHDQWRSNILPVDKLSNFYKVEQFDEASKDITEEEVTDKIPIFTDPSLIMEHCSDYFRLGASRVILHNVNREQEQFIRDFGEWRKRQNKTGVRSTARKKSL